MQSTPAVLKLYAHGWENTNIASTLLVIVTKFVHHLYEEKISIPFSYGNAFIYFLLVLENKGNPGTWMLPVEGFNLKM